MLVVGLTGGIATGKSSVSSLLKKRNLPVVDADLLAREVVLPGTTGLKKIVSVFGNDILLPDGSLDRKKLGEIIFNDAEKRKKLNGIVHPAVRRAMVWQIIKFWMKGEKTCFLDVPLLVEGGLDKLVGKVILVYCDQTTQLKRLMNRDESTEDSASSRIKSQMSIEDKVSHADYVLDNSGPLEALDSQVTHLLEALDRASGTVFWRLTWVIPPLGLLSAVFTLLSRRISRRKQQRF